jgi:hypothetical protein
MKPRNRILVTAATMTCSAADEPRTSETTIPDALGWAAGTPDGRGGRILRVTLIDH